MTPVGGKRNRFLPGGERAGFGFEASVEELVEAAESRGIVDKLIGANPEALDKGGDFFRRSGGVGPAPVETLEPAPFDYALETEAPEHCFVGPAERFFPVDAFSLEATFVSIVKKELLRRIHH